MIYTILWPDLIYEQRGGNSSKHRLIHIEPSNKLRCIKCFKSTLPVLATVHWMFCRDVSMYFLLSSSCARRFLDDWGFGETNISSLE